MGFNSGFKGLKSGFVSEMRTETKATETVGYKHRFKRVCVSF